MIKSIPKKIHQIWLGDKKPPKKWMATWKKLNPEWKYRLWTEKDLKKKWQNQKQIRHYKKRGMWHGVADIMRYQILYKHGGVVMAADLECLRPLGNLFNNGELFTVRLRVEEEKWEREDGKTEDPPTFITDPDKDKYTPIYASTKGHPFIKRLIEEIEKKEILLAPHISTGNLICTKLIKELNPKIEIFPMHYFYPYHPYKGESPWKYTGNDKPYAIHYWGTSHGTYEESQRFPQRDLVYITNGKTPTIKYSIRSAVRNIEFKRLVIVGPKIKGITPDIHISAKDTSDNKIKNVARKLLKVVRDRRITKEFILMDDDIFIMKKYQDKHYYKGALKKSIREHKKKGVEGGYHYKAQIETISRLKKNCWDYSVHAPFTMEKSNIREIEKEYKITDGKYLIRTIYGNEFLAKSYKTEDFKTSDYQNPEREIISTTDKIERSKEFKKFIKDKFPNKCKYEK